MFTCSFKLNTLTSFCLKTSLSQILSFRSTDLQTVRRDTSDIEIMMMLRCSGMYVSGCIRVLASSNDRSRKINWQTDTRPVLRLHKVYPFIQPELSRLNVIFGKKTLYIDVVR